MKQNTEVRHKDDSIMPHSISWRRIAIGLWGALFPFLVVMLLWPINSRSLRLGILFAVSGIILGSLVFTWKRPQFFFTLAAVYLLIGLFLLLPGRPPESVADLQQQYVENLACYEGVSYVWGGETRFGIDCSGLVRKSFQNTLIKKGVLTLNPALVRAAIDLWWNDTTAKEIGRGYGARTVPVASCSSLNALESDVPQPGDMAVTESGIHVMAYLGNKRWIGADPGEMNVVVFTIPEEKSGWFAVPMNIVRWKSLSQLPDETE